MVGDRVSLRSYKSDFQLGAEDSVLRPSFGEGRGSRIFT